VSDRDDWCQIGYTCTAGNAATAFRTIKKVTVLHSFIDDRADTDRKCS
jgi:hypothetical protein